MSYIHFLLNNLFKNAVKSWTVHTDSPACGECRVTVDLFRLLFWTVGANRLSYEYPETTQVQVHTENIPALYRNTKDQAHAIRQRAPATLSQFGLTVSVYFCSCFVLLQSLFLFSVPQQK